MKSFAMLACLLSCVLVADAQTPAPPPLNASAAPVAPAPAPPPPPAPRNCGVGEHRQFDFWIGDSDVYAPDGKLAGTNRIEPVLKGCVLHEHWVGRGNFAGESFNAWDARRKRWHQTWVDAGGNLLMLEGTLEAGSMTLSDADMPAKQDRNAINEIRWTPNADGSVRQLWRTSSDGGKTWAIAFDGKYVRAARAQPAR